MEKQNIIKIKEKKNQKRVKEEYSILTIRISSKDPEFQKSIEKIPPPKLKIPKPLVEKIEGPFDKDNNLVKKLEIGQTYIYKATKFKKSTFTPIKHIWFAEQIDDGKIIDLEDKKDKNPYIDNNGDICFKYKVKEGKTIRIYGYVAKPIKNVSINCDVKNCKSIFYFIGGAGNDQDGWNYINRFKEIFSKNGITGFKRIDASGGKARDVAFTTSYRNFSSVGKQLVRNSKGVLEYKLKRREHTQITKVIKLIKSDIQDCHSNNQKQLNLAGYSYGSVLMANVALNLTDVGYKIDNLILIGSPISDKSELFNALKINKKILNVIRHDINGDSLSNPQTQVEYLEGGYDNSDDTGHHFDLARPGKETDERIEKLAIKLKDKGIK